MYFDWDEANTAHIAQHHVLPYEAEEAATFKPVALYAAFRNGEERFVQIGETYAGRVLLIVTTLRDDKTRVVTAHDVDLSKRRSYALRRDVQYADREAGSP
jgi:uncharacterized DUF497 family protein